MAYSLAKAIDDIEDVVACLTQLTGSYMAEKEKVKRSCNETVKVAEKLNADISRTRSKIGEVKRSSDSDQSFNFDSRSGS